MASRARFETRASRAGAPTWAVAAGLAVGAAVLGGCRSADAAVHNLRELHEPDGTLARVAAPLGHTEYRWRAAFSSLPLERIGIGTGEAGGLITSKPPREIKRPAELVRRELDRLLDLADEDRASAGQAVEMATWLAVDDPSPVVRAMAIEELARAARRLGVRGLEESVDDLEEAERLRDVLGRLFLAHEARDAIAFQRCLGELSNAVASRDGAHRALRGVNALVGPGVERIGPPESLEAAHDELQRRCVAFGLSDALRDPVDAPRALAALAVTQVAPERSLALLEAALAENRLETLAALFDGARRNGTLPDARQRGDIERWCEVAVRSCDSPYGPLAVAACNALAELAPRLDPEGAPERSLRPESWFLWWSMRTTASTLGPPAPGGAPSP